MVRDRHRDRFGFLANRRMAYWLMSAFGFVLLLRTERRHLRGLLFALAIGMFIATPNLWWNANHGFVSILHVRDNAQLGGRLFHPAAFARFVISQFGVFGPIMLTGLIVLCIRLSGEPARLLAAFTWPTLLVALFVSLLSRAEPNWAAPAYVSAVVLVTSAARAWLATGLWLSRRSASRRGGRCFWRQRGACRFGYRGAGTIRSASPAARLAHAGRTSG